MPRNGSGVSSVVNTFVVDTVADPDEVNANFTDVADQLTNSLPRDGQAGMDAPLPLQNGTSALPALTFTSDTNTGLYRKGADMVGIAAGGVEADYFASGSIYATKSGNYTALQSDHKATHRYTAAATASLTAAATLGSNWRYTIISDGGAVTIDPNGSETINGLATLTVPNGASVTIICDGSNFFTVIRPQMWVPIGGVVDLAGLSANPWTNLSAYRDLRLRIAGIPSGTTGIPFLRVSSNNGSSYDSGASDYTNAHSVTEGTTVAGVASVSSTSFPLGNLAFDSQPFEFNITISEWNKAAVTSFDSTGYFGNTATGARRRQGAFGTRAASTAFDALQLSISAGTFSRGYAILEGVVG